MSAENRLPDYIEGMVQGATRAQTFTEEMDEVSFLEDIKIQSATAMCLVRIGEMANRIIARYPDFAQENPSIAWDYIVETGNRIAHDCSRLDFRTVWEAVRNDLAPLIQSLESIPADHLHRTPKKPVERNLTEDDRRIKMKPSEALAANRDTIRRLVIKHRTANPRVFGSVATGKDTASSDLDILVDTLPRTKSQRGTSFFNLGGLQFEMEEALGVKVDVLTPESFPPHIRDKVEEMAVPV